MIFRPEQSTGTKMAAGVIFAGFVFSLAVNLPGHLSYDSIIQLLEGRTGAYAGWHPPVTSWVLGLTDAIVPGTALFVLLDALLIFGSFWGLLRLRPDAGWVAAVLAALFAFTPQLLIYPGIVWKDVLFAAAFLMGFVLLVHAAAGWNTARRRYAFLIAAFILFVVASLARQNGLILLLGGACAVGWIALRNEAGGWQNFAKFAGGALVASLIVLTLANVALGMRLVRTSGIGRQIKLLQMYDIVAALSAEPGLRLDEIDRADPVFAAAMRSDGVRLYTPQRNDPLAASQSLSTALTAASPSLLRTQWLDLIAHHPWLYLKQRASMFGWVLFTPKIDACLPFYVGVQGPQDEMDQLNLDARYDSRDEWLQNYGNRFEGTPVFSHALFALLSLMAMVILFLRRKDTDIVMGVMQASVLLFTLSFFAISLACDYRYLYGVDLSAMLAWFYLALDWPAPGWDWRTLRFPNRAGGREP